MSEIKVSTFKRNEWLRSTYFKIIIFFQHWADNNQGEKEMESGVRSCFPFYAENTRMEGWKYGEIWRDFQGTKQHTRVHPLSNQNMTHSELVSFFKNVDSFSKVCVFLLYTEHTVR